MKKNIIVCSVLALSPIVTMHAQRLYEPNVGSRFDWKTPLEAKVVKGQPYSADVVSESVQTLGDGNRIVQRTTGRVYRDSEGRVRREEDRPSGTPSISIVDPTTGLSFALDPANRIARESPNALFEIGRLLLNVQQGAAIRFSDGKGFYLNGVAGGAVAGPGGRGFILAAPGGKDDQTAEEKLQDRVIEGVLASGFRKTTTIAKGAIGNEQPIKIVSEEWTSPELQVLVMTDHNDPRTGRSTYRLLKINRLDPDPTQFQVPPDYTVQRVGFGGRGAPGAGGNGERGGRGR